VDQVTRKVDTLIVGGGQAGLSLGAHLTARGHSHVVLERGRVGERWLSERWDSLHLLTPNWLNRLDGGVPHADRDDFLSRGEFVTYLEQYARSLGLPVREQMEVVSVEHDHRRFRVRTDTGEWVARHVVVATGDCGVPYRPAATADVPQHVTQLHAARYRRPEHLAAGSVLVVGAGASGLQIASELRRAGRDVFLAVGRHARAVRRYRGRDFWYWVERLGHLEHSVDDVPKEARRSPSFALSGQNGGEELDLVSVSKLGVALAGRLTSVSGSLARFDDSLDRTVADADERLLKLLASIDAHVESSPDAAEVPPAQRFPGSAGRRRRKRSISTMPVSPRSSGRRVIAANTRGCTSRSSTRAARSTSTTGSRRYPACSPSG
jgi:putative flavoprotein involved in K+ transport